jgi:hypothetical protein
MKQKSLAEYVEIHGQTETAKRAGLTQGAIWQMLRDGRRIFVTETGEDTVALEEVRSITRNSSAA